MKLIGIGGSTASGKTALARKLIEHFSAVTNRYSHLLSDIATSHNIPTDKVSLQELSTKMRAEQGEDAIALLMNNWIRKQPNEVVVIEGMRRLVDITLLEAVAKETNRDWVFLFVDAPTEIRFERYNERLVHDGHAPISNDEFYSLDSHEAEAELPLIRAKALHILHNSNKTLDELLAEALVQCQ